MRDYGKVHSSFWTSETTRSMSEDARILALYLLTCQHNTIAGVFRLPDGYVCDDMQWSSGRVSKGFAELLAKGFANRCETTKWVWVCKHFDWNPPENPNQKKSAAKQANSVPRECRWKPYFLDVCAKFIDPDLLIIDNPFETLSKPFLNQDQYQEQEQYQKQEQDQKQNYVEPERSTAPPPDTESVKKVFDHWRSVHQHPQAKLDAKRTKLIKQALKSYSEAELCQSISGYKNSSHHMGQNDRNTVYDSIELFLRDAQHIDAGRKFYAEPPNKLSTLTLKNLGATAGWVPPEMRSANAAN